MNPKKFKTTIGQGPGESHVIIILPQETGANSRNEAQGKSCGG